MRGIGIAHYNRPDNLAKILEAVQVTKPANCSVVVADDGSDCDVSSICNKYNTLLVKGNNSGVVANKNRVLWALRDCTFLCILEDDLIPIDSGWFEDYERAACLSGIHHFSRVQDKEVMESVSEFQAFMNHNRLTPIYGPNVRGDLTFITQKVVREVGAFNPKFVGVGYGHKEWSNRVVRAGLIPHPIKWVDIKESRDRIIQIGDTSGGRWEKPKEEVDSQIITNRQIYSDLKDSEIYHPINI
jgi:glycosyltransferase involved in cell wall biosynthesis